MYHSENQIVCQESNSSGLVEWNLNLVVLEQKFVNVALILTDVQRMNSVVMAQHLCLFTQLKLGMHVL